METRQGKSGALLMRILDRLVQIRSVWLAILLCLGLAIPTHAATIFTENYEVPTINDLAKKGRSIYNPTGTSSIVVGPTHPSATEGTRGGSRVLRQVYDQPVNCNPCNDGTNSYVGFHFSPQPEVWGRYYYMTEPINPATSSSYHFVTSKQHYMKVDGTSPDGIPNGGTTHLFGSRELQMGTQGAADCNNNTCGTTNDNPNKAHIPLQDNRWYCIEYHWKMNTPGVADGVQEIWVDGVQTLGYYTRKMRDTAHANAAFTFIQVYRQGANNMYRYEDDYVLATTRIGCSGNSSPASDTTPPLSPTGLTVR
jgi:hypothetical protein